MPTGSEAGVMVIVGQPTAMVKSALPAHPLASVAAIVMLALAVAVGVPLTTPVEAFKLSPAGSAPLMIENVYGDAALPLAVNVAVYAAPIVPAGGLPETVITGQTLRV